MCRHKTYPEALAGVLGGQSSRAVAALATFKRTWESFVWATRHQANHHVAGNVQRHSLACRNMQDLARIIRADDYECSVRARSRHSRYFSGFPHEHMFEICMRELRHQETRATSSQVVKSVKAH